MSLTQKSRLYLMFLKRPPTMAARWMTWVGLCFSNRALVSAAFLQRGRKDHAAALSHVRGNVQAPHKGCQPGRRGDMAKVMQGGCGRAGI